MTSPRIPVVLPAALLLASCMPEAFRVDAGAAFTRVIGETGLQNSGGSLNLNANMNDLEDAFAVGDSEAAPYARAECDWGPHRFKLSGFGHNSSGTGTLTGAFGDLPAGTQVASDLEFFNVSGSWSFDLAPSSMLRLAPGVQVGYYAIDMKARATSNVAFEEVDTAVIAPMPYLEAGVDLEHVSFLVDAGLIAADIRDAAGRFWDVEALARVRAGATVEVLAGFRYLLIDAHGTATGRDFDADIEVVGWFIGGGVRF